MTNSLPKPRHKLAQHNRDPSIHPIFGSVILYKPQNSLGLTYGVGEILHIFPKGTQCTQILFQEYERHMPIVLTNWIGAIIDIHPYHLVNDIVSLSTLY